MVFRIRWEFFCNKFGTKGGDLLWHILLVRMSDIAFLFKYLTNEFRRRFIFFFQYTDILTQSLHHSSVILDNIQKRLRKIVKIAEAWKLKTIQYYRCSLSPISGSGIIFMMLCECLFCMKGQLTAWSWVRVSENVIRGRPGPGLLHIDLTRWGHGNSQSRQVYTEITVRRIRDWKHTGIKKISINLPRARADKSCCSSKDEIFDCS